MPTNVRACVIDRKKTIAVHAQTHASMLYFLPCLEGRSRGLHRERYGLSIWQDHADDIVLDLETRIDPADRKDRAVRVAPVAEVEVPTHR